MTDQNINPQPKLSLEEELDIIEAVYKIGKEKGISLLQPDQVMKLVNSGRISSTENNRLKPIISKRDLTVEDVRNIHANVREVTAQIVTTMEKHFPEINVVGLDENQLKQLRQDLFCLSFGKSPQDYAFDLFTSLTSGEG